MFFPQFGETKHPNKKISILEVWVIFCADQGRKCLQCSWVWSPRNVYAKGKAIRNHRNEKPAVSGFPHFSIPPLIQTNPTHSPCICMGIYKSHIFLTAHTSEIQPFLGLGDLSTTPRANSGREQEARKACGSELCREQGPARVGTPAAPKWPSLIKQYWHVC